MSSHRRRERGSFLTLCYRKFIRTGHVRGIVEEERLGLMKMNQLLREEGVRKGSGSLMSWGGNVGGIGTDESQVRKGCETPRRCCRGLGKCTGRAGDASSCHDKGHLKFHRD